MSLLGNDEIRKIKDNEKYNYIIVDETQDFGRAELYNIKSFLKEGGSIHFFMDPNQSLSYDFNRSSQYVQDLCNDGKYRYHVN